VGERPWRVTTGTNGRVGSTWNHGTRWAIQGTSPAVRRRDDAAVCRHTLAGGIGGHYCGATAIWIRTGCAALRRRTAFDPGAQRALAALNHPAGSTWNRAEAASGGGGRIGSARPWAVRAIRLGPDGLWRTFNGEARGKPGILDREGSLRRFPFVDTGLAEPATEVPAESPAIGRSVLSEGKPRTGCAAAVFHVERTTTPSSEAAYLSPGNLVLETRRDTSRLHRPQGHEPHGRLRFAELCAKCWRAAPTSEHPREPNGAGRDRRPLHRARGAGNPAGADPHRGRQRLRRYLVARGHAHVRRGRSFRARSDERLIGDGWAQVGVFGRATHTISGSEALGFEVGPSGSAARIAGQPTVDPVIGRHVLTEEVPRIGQAPGAFHVERGTTPLSGGAELSPGDLAALRRILVRAASTGLQSTPLTAAGGSPRSASTASVRSPDLGASA
jgi:hypothetical protein